AGQTWWIVGESHGKQQKTRTGPRSPAPVPSHFSSASGGAPGRGKTPPAPGLHLFARGNEKTPPPPAPSFALPVLPTAVDIAPTPKQPSSIVDGSGTSFVGGGGGGGSPPFTSTWKPMAPLVTLVGSALNGFGLVNEFMVTVKVSRPSVAVWVNGLSKVLSRVG